MLSSPISFIDQIIRENSLLGLVFIMQYKNAKSRFLILSATLLCLFRNIFLQLANCVTQRLPRFISDENLNQNPN